MLASSRALYTFLLLCAVGFFSPLLSMHNTSRYFPFLEKPQPYAVRHLAEVYPAFFFTEATRTYESDGAHLGIPELWGAYNLNDVVSSRRLVQTKLNNKTFTNPFIGFRPDLLNQSIAYKMSGRIKSVGVSLAYEQRLGLGGQGWPYLSVGAWVPFMQVTSQISFGLDANNSGATVQGFSQSQLDELERIRRQIHQDIGLAVGDWIKTGFGDLDVHMRYHRDWDHKILMRKINLSIQGGLVIPTGRKRSLGDPASVPFMSNGHAGYYVDVMPEFELKDDWKLGFIFSLNFQQKKIQTMRLPVGNEPQIFSSLVGPARYKPGHTWKVVGYFTLENLIDGLNAQFRYNYIKHNEDRIFDRRSPIDQDKLPVQLGRAEDLSKWSAHYITLQFSFDTREASFKAWPFDLQLYALYDLPFNSFGGHHAVKMHQVTLGAEFYF